MSINETFSIGIAAKKAGLSEDTLRYYEKIGLLPRAERKDNKHRVYDGEDIAKLKMIACLKKTGMSLDEMRPFLAKPREELAETPELIHQLQAHRENIVSQISSLQQIVDFIDEALAGQTSAIEGCDLKGDDFRKMPTRPSAQQ